jgi:general stress protein 26
MDRAQTVNKIEEILDEAKTGILVTVNQSGKACPRWMTPAVLKQPAAALYCFTVAKSEKLRHIAANNNVVWMIQKPNLGEIVKIDGIARVIKSPSTKSELLEILGKRLKTFWGTNAKVEEFVVIETLIESVEYYKPIKGILETVDFTEDR